MFKGLGGIGNIASMVGTMNQLPEKLSELHQRMAEETVTMSSTCQQVTVVMTGVGKVQMVTIDVTADGEELHIAVMEATNAAGTAAKQMYADALSDMVGEMNLDVPGLDGILAKITGGG